MIKLIDEFKEELVGVEWKHYRNKIYGNNEMEVRYYFNDRRINQKYIQLCRKYEDIHMLDWNIMFNECTDIIFEVLDKMEKTSIYISNKEKKDDISYIITTMEQRINDKVNSWTGAYRDRSNGKDEIVSPDIPIYLDEVIEYEEGRPITRGETISNDDVITRQQKTDEEVDKSLEEIYTKAKLTDRQIEVLQALEMTEDNYDNGEIYTKVDAAKMLNTSDGNIRKTFYTIKNKVIKVYNGQVPQINTRQKIISILESFLDDIEDEKDVIDFIKSNQNEEFILYILYDSDLDNELVRCFNVNKDKDIYSDTMRKFCIYFIKEIYDYMELLKYNDNVNRVKRLPQRKEPQKPAEESTFIDNTVYRYIRQDKATEQQKENRYITIDGEKYYLVNGEKDLKCLSNW